MRIKRFNAPDMRTALRMIREEQGPDAVILSNRAIDGGIEVVAATDYDEALVAQALRAAAPGLETIAAAANEIPARPVAALPDHGTFGVIAAHPAASAPTHAPAFASATAGGIAEGVATAPAAPAPRESLVVRARAVFKIGDSPTLTELLATAQTQAAAAAQAVINDAAHAVAAPEPTRFEAMMAELASRAEPLPASSPICPTPICPTPILPTLTAPALIAPAPIATAGAATPDAHDWFDADDWAAVDSDYRTSLQAVDVPVAPLDAVVAPSLHPRSAPTLHAVAAGVDASDPSLVAMREDLAGMRQLIERQMEQLSLQRLRGSPARAAAYDALVNYGCEDVLAQAVAARIDPRLEPAQVQAPMFAELARMLTVARSEALDEGGVIALVGPTGAGKTTTAAKLAARFAARHRARDVALVTTDGERAGAHEQLHAHGRRLGITVCAARGPEGLADALAQLSDYPLVLVDTTGYAPRDRALFGQILWLRAARKVRSLLVLPANAHPHDLGEVIRRYRPAAPEGVVLTKLDETGRLGSALSVAVRHGLTLAYTTHGQQVPSDIAAADATHLAQTLEKLRRAADNPLATEDRHAFA